jgi:hypothetical protein
MKGRNTADNISIIKNLIEDAKTHNKTIYIGLKRCPGAFYLLIGNKPNLRGYNPKMQRLQSQILQFNDIRTSLYGRYHNYIRQPR